MQVKHFNFNLMLKWIVGIEVPTVPSMTFRLPAGVWSHFTSGFCIYMRHIGQIYNGSKCNWKNTNKQVMLDENTSLWIINKEKERARGIYHHVSVSGALRMRITKSLDVTSTTLGVIWRHLTFMEWVSVVQYGAFHQKVIRRILHFLVFDLNICPFKCPLKIINSGPFCPPKP